MRYTDADGVTHYYPERAPESQYGKIAYEAYVSSSESPPWEQLDDTDRARWNRAAQEVVKAARL